MNTNDVIGNNEFYKIVQKKTGLPILEVSKAVRVILKEIGIGVYNHDKVVIWGFGKFHRWYFRGRMDVNYGLIPAEWRPGFKPSITLKEIINHEREVPPVLGLRSRDYSTQCKRRMSNM